MSPTVSRSEYNIVVFPGDGASPEVMREAVKVLKTVERCSKQIQFNFKYHLLGGCSIDAHGTALTDNALAAAKAAHAVLLGPVGGPKWGVGKARPEQGLLKVRKETGTFGNLRPCYFASPRLLAFSPLKEEVCRGTDFITVRELTGGLYFGDRVEANPDDGDGEWAEDREPYSRREIERITRLAANLALARDPPAKVWSLDKANVLATSRLWRRVVTEIMHREFPELQLEHQLVDSAAMRLVKDPRSMNGVILTSNLFGDLISDGASAIPGTETCLPSASLSGIQIGKSPCFGIYEPCHSSSPSLAGQGSINPIGAILSAAMLLTYSINRPEESKLVEQAVKVVIEKGIVTRDLGGTSTTGEVADEVVKELELLFSSGTKASSIV